MDFRYLKAFLAVAETKSFTAAANKLKIAQSAVSRQIRLLEDELGQQLFVRSRKLVVLTPAGFELNHRARTFTDWYEGHFQDVIPEIRIGGIQGAIDGWLIERLHRLKPEALANLNIQLMDDAQVRERLIRGELDLGLTTHRIENEAISSRRMIDETFSLISSKPIDIKNIHEECWISGQRGMYLQRLTKKQPKRWIKVNSLFAIQSMVAAGFGVAVLADHILDEQKFKYLRKPVKVGPSSVYLSMPNYRVLPEHIKSILAVL